MKRAVRLSLHGASLWGSALLLSCQGSLDAYFALGPLGAIGVVEPTKSIPRLPLGDSEGAPGAQGPTGGASTASGGGGGSPPGTALAISLLPRYRLASAWPLPAGLPVGAPSHRSADDLWLVALPQAGQLWGLAAGQAPRLLGGDPSAPAGLADQQALATATRLPQLQAAVVHASSSLAWLVDRGQARLRVLTPAASVLPYGGSGNLPPALGEAMASVAFQTLGDLSLDAQGGGAVAEHSPPRLVAWNPQRRISAVVDLPATPGAVACQDDGLGAWVAIQDTVYLARWSNLPPKPVWQAPGPILGVAQHGGRSLYLLARQSANSPLAGLWHLPLNGDGLKPLDGQVLRVGGALQGGPDAPASGVADWMASQALEVPLWAPAGGGLHVDRRADGSAAQMGGDLWFYGHRGPVADGAAELLRMEVLQ